MDIQIGKVTPEVITGVITGPELGYGHNLKIDNDFYAKLDVKSKTLILNINQIHLLKDSLEKKDIEKIVLKKDTVLYVDSLMEDIGNIITDR